jgi:hypothetical protein
VGGVIFEHVGQVRRITQVVDRNNFDVTTLMGYSKDEAADPAKSVDGNLKGHISPHKH